jgi:iron complex outermembrane recepter protein
VPKIVARRSVLIPSVPSIFIALSAHTNQKPVDVPAGDLRIAVQLLAKQSGAEITHQFDELKGLRTHGFTGHPLLAPAAVGKLLRGTSLHVGSPVDPRIVVRASNHRRKSKRKVSVEESPDSLIARSESMFELPNIKKSTIGDTHLAQAKLAPVAGSPPTHPSAPDSSRDQLDTVVVTAQRREENLQAIPVAITAANATELLNEGVIDTASLSLAVPGLMVTNSAAPFIRGVGTSINSVGNEASVATYVDGVYISSINASLFELNNIDRIEVLKGPQGTLFGRNATGGVIQIITKDPSFTTSADLHVGYGTYNTTSVSFYGTTGLGESVAVDLAAYGTNQADGWGSDLVTGQPTFTRHDFGARSKLLWTPEDGTRILIAADYNRTRNEDGLGWHVVPPGVGIDGVTRFNGFYNTYDDPNDQFDFRQSGLSLKVEQNLTAVRLENITSWRNANAFLQLDQDATPLEVVDAAALEHDQTVTEEMHLLSKDGASLRWIAGIYYYDDLSAYDPLGLMGQVAAPLDEIQIWSALKSKSYAAFGQVTPRIGTGTQLTLGARYTKDERADTGSTLGLLGTRTLMLAAASQSTSWSKPTWRVALDHQFTHDVMGYISYDRGFKSGVYNLSSYAAPPVNPETLDAYQLGIKSELTDHRLRLNAAAFHYNYKDIQVDEIVTGGIMLVNAATAEMNGIDVDFAFLPVDTLSVRGGFEIMSGHYTNFKNAPFYSPTLGANGEPVGGNTQSEGNASGFDTVRTPKETATSSAAYRVPVPSGNLNFVLSNYYNSGFAHDPDNRLRQSSYDVLNASVEWNAPKNAWGVRLDLPRFGGQFIVLVS